MRCRKAVALWRELIVLAMAGIALGGCDGVEATNPYDPLAPAALQAPATLLGSVVLEGAASHAGASVHVAGMSAITDEAGDFILDRIPPGIHDIVVNRDAGDLYRPLVVPGVAFGIAGRVDVGAQLLPLHRGALAGSAQLADRDSHGGVRITVVRRDPLPGADVFLMEARLTSSGGDYRFENLPVGRYRILAEADGFTLAEEEMDVEAFSMILSPPLVLYPLTAALQIDLGAPFTRSRDVALRFLGLNVPVGEMMISEDPTFEASEWDTFAQDVAFTLSDGEGRKTVHVRLDADGQTIDTSASIVLDRTPPWEAGIAVAGGQTHVTSRAVDLLLSADDSDPDPAVEVSGVAEMRLSETADCSGGAWAPYQRRLTLPLTDGDGEKPLSVRYRDRAGNETECAVTQVILKTEPPLLGSPPLVLAGGAATVYDPLVDVTLSVIGAEEMALAEDEGLAGAVWQPYAATTSWLFPRHEGSHTLHARFRDGAGNVTERVSASVEVRFRGTVAGIARLEGAESHDGILVTVNGTSYAATTDAEGVFVIEDVPEGLQAISAHASGYQRYDYPVMNIGAGQTADVGEVTLQRTRGQVEGEVRLPGETDQGGARVELLGTSYVTWTGSDGRYTFSVPVGNYAGVVASMPHFSEERHETTVTVTEEGSAIIPRLTLTREENDLFGRATLFGEVDHSGIEVRLTTLGGDLVASRTTEPDGSYDFGVVALGTYHLRFFHGPDWEAPLREVTVGLGEGTEVPPVVLRHRFIVIDDYAPVTTSLEVVLTLGASDALTMELSELADLSDAVEEPFQTSLAFTFSEGDGLRRVYARFFDSTGSPSSVVYDEILVDTTAEILSVSEDTGGETMGRGAVIAFLVDTGEPGGEVTIEIEGYATGLVLRDDGQSGDGEADSGVYGLLYEISGPNDVDEARVIARFVDPYGNVAVPMEAPGRVTIQSAPLIYDLQLVPQAASGTALVSWRTDELATARIDWGPDNGYGSQLEETQVSETHAFTLTDLSPSARYHFRVHSTDVSGNEAVDIDRTFWMGPEQPVRTVAMGGDGRIDVTWEPPPQKDVAGYLVLRSSDPEGPFQALNPDDLVPPVYPLFSDLDVQNGETWQYVVQAVDSFDNVSDPGEVVSASATANGGGTQIAGVVPDGSVWTTSGSPYVLTGHALVEAGSTLHIGPGTEIVVQDAESNWYQLYVDGIIKVLGTGEAPVSLGPDGFGWIRVRGPGHGLVSEDGGYRGGILVGFMNGPLSSSVTLFDWRRVGGGVSVGIPPGSCEDLVERGPVYLAGGSYRQVVATLGNCNEGLRPLTVWVDRSIVEEMEVNSGYDRVEATHVHFPYGNVRVSDQATLHVDRSRFDVPAGCCPPHFSHETGGAIAAEGRVTIERSLITVEAEGQTELGRLLHRPAYVSIRDSEIRLAPSFDASLESIIRTGGASIDVRNNYWGPEITAEMDQKGPNANLSIFYDYFDDITLGRAYYEDWLSEAPEEIGPDWDDD
jgi:hypothetical protein